MDNNPARTGLVERLAMLLVILEIINTGFDILSKAVNYNDRPISKLRLQLQS